jgi:hypothetical protein
VKYLYAKEGEKTKKDAPGTYQGEIKISSQNKGGGGGQGNIICGPK